ncbi:hypothetical protein ACFVAJ_16080 [Agromyces sp. NPDC057679]|uniref:hypothetical protein n=1 Tax=Agromyces sp. NPDC057679 TaxID=3346207 RepID=UPI00366F9E1F
MGEQQLLDRLWDFADPEASAERFSGLANDESETAHTRAVMQTQLARALGLLGRGDEALAVLDRVAALPAADDEPAAFAAELRARVAIERGRLAATDGRPADAVPELTRGVREAAIAGSTFLVLDALHMLALNDVGHEEVWATEGFDVLDGTRDPRLRRWGVALHNNLGWTLHDSGRLTGALMQFEEASRAAEAYGTAQQRHVAKWSVARCLRSLGRTDEALELQRALAFERPDDPYVQAELAALTEAPPTIEA